MTQKRGLNVGLKGKLKSSGDAKTERKITLGMMGVCILAVGAALLTAYFSEPNRVAEKEFKKLAVEYYEKYYYPEFVEELDEERFEERMAFYNKVGVQTVTLKQVLSFNHGMNRGSEKYFNRDGFVCDKKQTTARFFPEEPYGAQDYRVEFEMKCGAE